MARPLVVVAVAGFAVSAVCLTLASIANFGVGPPFQFTSPPRHNGNYPWGLYPWTTYLPFRESGEIVTRDYDWSGDVLDLAMPGTVHFQAGPERRVTARGPKSAIEHLIIEDGRVFFDGPTLTPHTSAIEIQIVGPRLDSVAINGRGKVVLEHLAQEQLSIDIRGRGSIAGNGSVRSMKLGIVGRGVAELANLTTGDLMAGIVGKGSADLSPSGHAQVSIVGSGEVRLHAKPQDLSQNIVGSGRITQMPAQ